MTILLRIILIIASLFTTALLMHKIRRSKVQIEDSIFWVIFSVMLILFSVFPGVADFLSKMAGTYSTSNFIFLFIIFLLLYRVFTLTVRISQLETRLKELVQRISLDENNRMKKLQTVEGESRDEDK